MYGKSLQGHCEHCGDWFRDSRRGRPSKYCSPSCRQMAYLENKLAMSEGITKVKNNEPKELDF